MSGANLPQPFRDETLFKFQPVMFRAFSAFFIAVRNLAELGL